ncbi:DNA mismatch repair protein MutT [Streptomyces sp. NPDC048584]|uniref:DNA mismatch repair protein MutT n=1 Tax=Streptomyces sp. NPDC048584 TaxID=3365573 RepID=UPI003712C2A0
MTVRPGKSAGPPTRRRYSSADGPLTCSPAASRWASSLICSMREELGVDAEAVERVPGEWPLRTPYVMRVWTARLRPGSPAPRPLEDHDELRWLTPDRIWDVDWLDHDVPAVRDVLVLGPGGARVRRDSGARRQG